MIKEKEGNFLKVALMAFLTLMIYGCNISYLVRNQFRELSEVLHFPCGKVSVELRGKGNSKFIFYQQIYSEENFLINPDSLHIFFNHEEQTLTHRFKKIKTGENSVLENIHMLETSFNVKGGVFEGDTVVVYAEEYVICDGLKINLDSLVFPFVNNIRISGINSD